MDNLPSIGLTHLAYRLPPGPLRLSDLEQQGRLSSPAAFLAEVGFEQCHVHDDAATFDDLLLECGQELIAKNVVPQTEIAWLIRYSGLEPERGARSQPGSILERFRYPLARAQHRLGLPHAGALALSQQGCCGLLSSLDLASRLLGTSDATAALCLAGDTLGGDSSREILYNLMSDAGAAVLMQKHATKNRIVKFRQQTAPYYWDTPSHTPELLAAYFPIAQRVILRCLEEADRSLSEVRWFVPHNVSRRSWAILARLLGVGEDAIWSHNIPRIGHTVSCDHLINLRDMEQTGALKPGDLLVLFTFGFGASWSCMLLEH